MTSACIRRVVLGMRQSISIDFLKYTSFLARNLCRLWSPITWSEIHPGIHESVSSLAHCFLCSEIVIYKQMHLLKNKLVVIYLLCVVMLVNFLVSAACKVRDPTMHGHHLMRYHEIQNIIFKQRKECSTFQSNPSLFVIYTDFIFSLSASVTIIRHQMFMDKQHHFISHLFQPVFEPSYLCLRLLQSLL